MSTFLPVTLLYSYPLISTQFARAGVGWVRPSRGRLSADETHEAAAPGSAARVLRRTRSQHSLYCTSLVAYPLFCSLRYTVLMLILFCIASISICCSCDCRLLAYLYVYFPLCSWFVLVIVLLFSCPHWCYCYVILCFLDWKRSIYRQRESLYRF